MTNDVSVHMPQTINNNANVGSDNLQINLQGLKNHSFI
jgi:hypothetical protein